MRRGGEERNKLDCVSHEGSQPIRALIGRDGWKLLRTQVSDIWVEVVVWVPSTPPKGMAPLRTGTAHR